MSIFATALESADASENVPAAPAVSEDETATSEVSSVDTAAQDIAQESADMDQLGQEQEDLGEVEETIEQESAGLSPEAARYLNISLKRIIGHRAANKIIATENYSGGRASQENAKRFALEGIRDTLKSFWEAIKAQLKKFYNKVKSFFVKMFSGAKKLKERAEAIQKKANDTIGTMEEKSFSFSQTKAIAVDGKYNDAGAVTTGLASIRKWIEANLTVSKSEQYESAIEGAQTAIEKAVKDIATDLKDKTGGGKASAFSGAAAVTKALADLGKVGISPLGISSPDAKLVEMYGGGKGSTDKVAISNSLPGGRAIVAVRPDMGATTSDVEGVKEWTKRIKNTRLTLGNDKFTPRDVTEGDVKTLTTSQIDKVCDDVIEIADSAYTYEKAWERRNKFQEKLEREIDSIVKDINSDDDADSRAQGVVRSYAEAFTASVRRRTTFESQFISYSLTTGNAFLNYAEKSLSQHKAK